MLNLPNYLLMFKTIFSLHLFFVVLVLKTVTNSQSVTAHSKSLLQFRQDLSGW